MYLNLESLGLFIGFLIEKFYRKFTNKLKFLCIMTESLISDLCKFAYDI